MLVVARGRSLVVYGQEFDQDIGLVRLERCGYSVPRVVFLRGAMLLSVVVNNVLIEARLFQRDRRGYPLLYDCEQCNRKKVMFPSVHP
ncbi:hypothetical protein BVRB_1g022960 [Beta vulgaris subsp. vulgaris]|uniref:Uncharacterized protein n=1 Tax=Beta vulgaris subsp. vulgaris TaxID=3555 RepID=A0A0J8BHP4_BETVV|nr:hypothetical protein BVRB_1g022960 [Beta vulgaris subsp. vulgaris]